MKSIKPFFMHRSLLHKSDARIHFNNLVNQQIQVLNFFSQYSIYHTKILHEADVPNRLA